MIEYRILNRAIERNGFVRVFGYDFPPVLAKRLKADYNVTLSSVEGWNLFKRDHWRCVTISVGIGKGKKERLFMVAFQVSPLAYWETLGKEHIMELNSCKPNELKRCFVYFNWLLGEKE